jgi:hypothetical protein
LDRLEVDAKIAMELFADESEGDECSEFSVQYWTEDVCILAAGAVECKSLHHAALTFYSAEANAPCSSSAERHRDATKKSNQGTPQ